MVTGNIDHWHEGSILIIEDDEGLAELIRSTLEESGFTCEHAMTGSAALARLETVTPALMLLDYTLPDMNGLELINALLAGPWSIPPYLMITAREDTRLAVSIMKQGARDYVVKDVEFLDRLPALVKRISKEVATEKRLSEAEQALRESEARLAKAQQIARLGSWEWIPATGRIVCSEGISLLLGVPPPQLETITPELLASFVHPADFEQVKKLMKALLEDDVPFSADWRLLREDHSEIYVSGQGEVEVQADGTRRIFSGTLLDITERKRAEEERAKLELQLLQTQKLESLGVLAGGIAHDFNNILTAIKGNISYARMDLDATHPACAPLARAEKAVKRAADLARQLLVFAKGGDPVKKVVSLRQIVNEAVSLTLSGTNVQVVLDLAANLHVINADEGQINQAFHNIIINAVQAMPAGGRLTVSGENVTLPADNSHGRPVGDYVSISFTDEGCGIAAADLQRIFDPYFTNKAEGSGLGLTSAYSIINKHDGEITVSSKSGRGTTVTILLPSLDDSFTVQGEIEAPSIDSHGTDAILVMDDDEMIRELAAITLKRLGYAVTTCASGKETISLYRAAMAAANPFSLVIMDLTIPGGMGGVETARQILAFDPNAHLIVSSGYSEDPVMSNFTDYGFCASLEKPYKVEDVSGILLRVKRESAGKVQPHQRGSQGHSSLHRRPPYLSPTRPRR